NAWMVTTNNQLLLRHPRGPLKTEVWCFTLVDRSLLEKEPQRYYQFVRQASQGNGPAGMFEQEDGENWAQSTVGTTGTHARRFPDTANPNGAASGLLTYRNSNASLI